MKISTEELDKIALKLRNMPSVEKMRVVHTKQEAVKMLAKEIMAMKKRGYSLDQIAETLRGEGIAVATPTLKNYLQRAKPKPVKKEPLRAAGDTPPPAPALNNPSKNPTGFTPRNDSDDI